MGGTRNTYEVKQNYIIVNNSLLATRPSHERNKAGNVRIMYGVIPSVLDPRKCEYVKDYSLDFEHAYMTTRPPLWSSGQSFWLQIQRSRVRFPALPDFSE